MFYSGTVLDSIDPCFSLFGYTYWSYLIPPFRPERVLVLGSGRGTVSGLLRRIFGDVVIDLVDSEFFDNFGINHVSDAKDFLFQTSEKWDYIVVDLSDQHGVLPMVFSAEFVELVKSRCSRMVGLNCFARDRDRARIWAESFAVESMSAIQGNLIYKLRLPELTHTMQQTYDEAEHVGLQMVERI